MTREEAITALRQCQGCRRWITTQDCDHCYVDRLPPRPPTPEQALVLLNTVVRLGHEAQAVRARLAGLLT